MRGNCKKGGFLVRACFGQESRNKPVFFVMHFTNKFLPLPRRERDGVRVKITIFSPSPLSPPAKGGEDLREKGDLIEKVKRKDSTD